MLSRTKRVQPRDSVRPSIAIPSEGRVKSFWGKVVKMPLAKTTKDHDEIRKWAEARGGKPAVVAATEDQDETGILRLMFPDAPNHNDGALEEISWDEFFEKFDESGLELTYQEKTAEGQTSDFNKLTYPDADSTEGKALLHKTSGKKRSAKKSAAKKSTAQKSASTKIPAKVAAKKSAAKKTPAKTAGKKTAAKKTANKSASKKSSASTPARNYPKAEHNGPTQVF